MAKGGVGCTTTHRGNPVALECSVVRRAKCPCQEECGKSKWKPFVEQHPMLARENLALQRESHDFELREAYEDVEEARVLVQVLERDVEPEVEPPHRLFISDEREDRREVADERIAEAEELERREMREGFRRGLQCGAHLWSAEEAAGHDVERSQLRAVFQHDAEILKAWWLLQGELVQPGEHAQWHVPYHISRHREAVECAWYVDDACDHLRPNIVGVLAGYALKGKCLEAGELEKEHIFAPIGCDAVRTLEMSRRWCSLG